MILCVISKTNVIINLSIKNAKILIEKINSTLASTDSILNSMYRYPGTYQCSNSGYSHVTVHKAEMLMANWSTIHATTHLAITEMR